MEEGVASLGTRASALLYEGCLGGAGPGPQGASGPASQGGLVAGVWSGRGSLAVLLLGDLLTVQGGAVPSEAQAAKKLVGAKLGVVKADLGGHQPDCQGFAVGELELLVMVAADPLEWSVGWWRVTAEVRACRPPSAFAALHAAFAPVSPLKRTVVFASPSR